MFIFTAYKSLMKGLNNTQAIIIAVFIMLVTMILGLLLPGHTIILSGLLLAVLVTIFIQSAIVTNIVGLTGMVLIIIYALLYNKDQDVNQLITQTIFHLLLVSATVFIVNYVRRLYTAQQLDKTHLSSLFENATEGIFLTNDKGVIILVNPAAERMFRFSATEMIGKKVEMLIPHRYKVEHEKLRNNFYKHPQDRQMGSGRDLHGARKGGEDFPVEVSLSYYHHKNHLYVIAFIVDITLRKQAEAEMIRHQQQLESITNDIRKLNAQLEIKVEERTAILKEALQNLEQSQDELSEALDKERQLNDIKSRFVSMASHEFRTPLSTVLSSASLISKYQSTEEQPKRDRHIIKIKESIKHLNDILEDFLSLGKLDEGKVKADKQQFIFTEYLQDLSEELSVVLKPGQQFKFQHTGPQKVFTDPKLLKHVLINLLTNASKFSGEGQVINIDSEAELQTLEINIADKGIGISKEDQQHLFSTFYRGKNAMNIPGTGLGLHIVQRYVNLLQGELEIESQLGAGTTVRIKLPINEYNEIDINN
jgi:PAS domain S-box-containing protein